MKTLLRQKSVLFGLKKEELLTTVSSIYNIAFSNATQVADFGATPEALESFKADFSAEMVVSS